MPRPTSATTVQRPILSQFAHEFMAESARRGFIGLQALPTFTTPEQSADIGRLPREQMLKRKDLKRAARGQYNRGSWEFETLNYATVEYGWEEPVDDVEARLYDDYFNAEVVSLERAMHILLMEQEYRAAAAVFNNSTWTETDVSNAWSDATNATPKADVNTAKDSIRNNTGLVANTLIIGYTPFQNLLVCDEIKDYIKYTHAHLLDSIEVQKQLLAQYFGLSRVLVGNAIYDSAKEGQSASLSDIWDDEYAMVCVTSDGGRDLRKPMLGRSMLWTGDSPTNAVVESYRDESIRGDVIRVRHHVDEKIFDTAAAELLGNITA